MNAANKLPEKLSEAGIFKSLVSLELYDGWTEYSINAPFWSGGAKKRRWIKLPSGQKINNTSMSKWDFPVGSRIVKHFSLGSQSQINIETREITKLETGWRMVTYEWQLDQQDAILLEDSKAKDFQWYENDQYQKKTWNYPGPLDCLSCHNRTAQTVLGVITEQLNGNLENTNQLISWSKNNFFSTPVTATDELIRYVDPYDETASLNLRARSYLATNCSQCHHRGGTAPNNMDLKFGTDLEAMHVFNYPADNSLNSFVRIKPNSPDESEIIFRMNSHEFDRMPPIEGQKDESGINLLKIWINSLPN